MKIGIYDPYLDDLGGGEKYMMKIAQCLSEKNDVFVFWDQEEDLKDLRERFLLNLSRIKLTKNIFSENILLPKRLAESKKYDIIILLSDGSIPLLLSKKTFVHVQQPLPRKGSNLKTRLKIARINKFFCNSNYTKNYIDGSFSVNSSVLYPPVELKPRKIKKENVILTVGRFRVKDITTVKDKMRVGVGDYKKHGFMIDTFRKMIDGGLKNYRFVIAISVKDHDREDFNLLKERTKGYPIEFLINKNNNELWDIYSRAKIYWHASGFGEDLEKYPEYAEHFGISTVEAMGAGAVPVVINAGGQAEIINDGGNGLLWNTQEELIIKTQKLLESEKLFEKLSDNARKRAKYFAGDRFCSELFKILDL